MYIYGECEYIYIYIHIYVYIYIYTHAHGTHREHATRTIRQMDKIQKNEGIPNRIREQFFV